MLLQELKYIIQSSHINFLYGSGMSKPYLATLGKIEEYLTRLDKDLDASDKAYNVTRASLYKTYCEGVIIPNSVFPIGNPKYEATAKAYRDFFHIWNDLINKRSSLLLEKQVNLFTTNIDLLVEKTLSNSRLELNDGFRGTLSPIFSESNFQISLSKSSMQYHKAAEIPVFNLMKVHGSVNWENIDGHICSNLSRIGDIKKLLDTIPSDQFVSLQENDADGHSVDKSYEKIIADADKINLVNENVFEKFLNEYDKIVMINPTKEKFKTSVMDYHFYELMRIFSNALERENSVLFVMGFSYADEHLAEITSRAAATNPTLQVLIFAYSDDDKDNYLKNLGIDSKGINNNIKIITPSVFKEINKSSDKNEEFQKWCESIDHFDLQAINSVFEKIGLGIHSSI